MSPEKPSVAIIGAGNVGQAVGRGLLAAGYPVLAVSCRTPQSAQKAAAFVGAKKAAETPEQAAAGADAVLIATPDGAIGAVCGRIASAGSFRRGAVVLHFSGALGSDALAPAAREGAHVGAMHPMQSFPSPEEGLARLPGTVFTFEGDEEAETTARRMATDLGGETLRIEASAKALYHAACCALSNYVAAAADLGFELMEHAGVPRHVSLRAAMPLIKGSVANIERLGLPAALTGPIERGDAGTVERHLQALASLPPELGELYRQLGRHTLHMAKKKGRMDEATAKRLEGLLGG